MPHHHPLRGALLFIFALLLFACLDTTIKYLAARHPVPLIVAVRYIVNLLLMTLILAPRHGKVLFRTQRTGWVIVRAVALSIGSLSIALALQRMPVAETTAILFFSPVIVVLLARPLLGERAGKPGLFAALLGFAGVMLIARPGGGLDPIGVAIALVGMSANVAYQLLSRILAASETTMALLFYTALTGTIIFGIAAPFFLDGTVPTRLELLLFLSLGVYGGLGHYLYTAAFRETPAPVLATINYLQLLFAALLGWIVFDHLPDPLALTGMGVIAAAGAIVAITTRRPPIKRMV